MENTKAIALAVIIIPWSGAACARELGRGDAAPVSHACEFPYPHLAFQTLKPDGPEIPAYAGIERVKAPVHDATQNSLDAKRVLSALTAGFEPTRATPK